MIDCSARDYEDLISKEWIVTNGIGGYASATVTGANTRRYHGLLVASEKPPVERKLLVSKVEEAIRIDGNLYRLSTNEYPDTVYPQGFKYLHRFSRSPLPCSTFKLGEIELQKTIWMVHGSNTTIIEYKNNNTYGYQIWLNPLYVYRDFHKVENERADHKYKVKFMGRTQNIRACEEAEPLYFKYTLGSFHEERTWNRNLQFRVDKFRGNEFSEDVYSIGYLEHFLEAGQSLFLVFTTDRHMVEKDPSTFKEEELKRLEDLVKDHQQDQYLADLIKSGDQFMVHRKSTNSASVIAGYHWFSDWGRDAMIAIRGLCIATGRQEEARSVIGTFLSYLKDGLIPNRFPDYAGEELEYNTADATLWLLVALYEYDLKFNDTAFIKKVLPRLKDIIEAHLNGTQHNIYVLPDGLLHAGEETIQITWMDARLDDLVFTPRHGCAVEINVLWYNALKIYDHFCERTGSKLPNYESLSEKLKKTFNEKFWNEGGYLNDVIRDNQVDTSIRPNQIFALSLPFSILSKKREMLVLENIRTQLLTPYGLRTLEKNDPAFREKYEGDWYQRDEAYHQGTVWPFLLPEYLSAFFRINGSTKKAAREILQFLEPLKEHFYKDNCIHAISEVFDGLEPGTGKGCAQQAWSVSNLILLLMNEKLRLSKS